MADTKISALAALTGVATNDRVPLVDVSDTSMASTGTTKYATVSDLLLPVTNTLLKTASVSVANANVPAYTIPIGGTVFKVDGDGRIHGGQNRLLNDSTGSTMHNSVPDFLYDAATMRTYTRSLILAETGDSPEIQLRRSGPDNQYPYPTSPAGRLTGIENGKTLGQITWYPFETPLGGTVGTTAASVGNPSGAIYMHAAQDIYAGKAGGQMFFATTPIDSGNYVTAMVIQSNQHIFCGGSDIARFSVAGAAGDEASKVAVFQGADTQSADIVDIRYGSSHNNALAVKASSNTVLGPSTNDDAQFIIRNHTSGQSIVKWNNDSNSTLLDFSNAGVMTLSEGVNVATGTSTGTQIGTSTNQKLGFWATTPVTQQVLATGAGKTVDNVITFLQTLGLCKQS